MQRPAPASASPSAVQSCPRRRAVGACDEPTDRPGGQLVSEAQNCPKPPTDSPEEPKVQTLDLRGQVGDVPALDLIRLGGYQSPGFAAFSRWTFDTPVGQLPCLAQQLVQRRFAPHVSAKVCQAGHDLAGGKSLNSSLLSTLSANTRSASLSLFCGQL